MDGGGRKGTPECGEQLFFNSETTQEKKKAFVEFSSQLKIIDTHRQMLYTHET